ncbi:hypothetical protein EMIHUDRAFT_428787 [Emiliania huxleyi CCMP1516]|uniref:ABC transporter domain-containing protein n=4 Tax=Emiliania huxleyi TaxID=2903 RepID=A0A0D3KXA8_EMIH1|nr:hypothetical protein EMIHUDRAFT_428787 [Emiliania huxleyi CCMP1516]EOD40393.1 hypothetical protein EMIHUDRAFT_428787 [Emiliania huxleyi CCMP1516]|eukprot:XP_005792822.1 hypothetical protein EMIHUDRAFT_428787 [Emiliania huxleyi CCMP1516]
MTERVTIDLGEEALSWSGLRLSVRVAQTHRRNWRRRASARTSNAGERKVILDDVSGCVAPSEMIALMGPSGSGKTSLLSLLAGRAPKGAKLEAGEVTLGGAAPTKAFFRRCGFVFQDDLLLAALTVRETIEFAARLRLPQSLGDEERDRRVQTTLQQLGLEHCAHTAIGSEKKRGVSGGERKRTAVGAELVARPPLLFLDEPTSGLDAATALSLTSCLQSVARTNRMILVLSVHQPRSNIFSLFDQLLLLSGGRVAYNGAAADAVAYMQGALGEALPSLTNPADWLIDLVDERPAQLLDCWAREGRGDGGAGADGGAVEEASSRRAKLPSAARLAGSHFATSSWWQFCVLLERSAKQQRGDVYNLTNIFQILAVAVIAAILWSGATTVSDIKGVLFFVNIQQAFNAQNTVLRLFPLERQLMLRERRCGTYRMLPYFLARSAADSFAILVLPVLYAIIIYFSVGLRPGAGPFFTYLALSLSTVFTGQSIGLFISLLIPDLALSSCVSFIFVLMVMLFGGFYVGVDRIPGWISWMRYASFMFWGYSGMVINEFGGREVDCDQAGVGEFGDACPFSGDEVIRALGYDGLSVGLCGAMLITIALALRVAAYLCLRLNITLGV